MEIFRRRPPSSERYDAYEEATGEHMDIEIMMGIRWAEDYLISLHHISDADRYPVPYYLEAEWSALVGPNEERREREDLGE